MCGIAGYLSARPDRATVELMCNQLRHRGPDGSGVWLGNGVALGRQRLSIIDVTGGAQPLSNEDGTVWVTFNGEIYNYREWKEQLLRNGHRFATHTDTEVLVHLYEEYGERIPEYLRGMFAFAIWDIRRETLFLARDRLGEKPLYYSSSVPGMTFCFASELKALAVLRGFDKRVDREALTDFLALSYVPDPKSIYGCARKLPPGHSLTISSNGHARLSRYWQPQFHTSKHENFDDAAEELRALAQDAVRSQRMSDVPLGAFLSGGVDSSSVVGIMAEASPEPVKTYSIGFSDKQYDERAYARAVASRHKTQHVERVLTPWMREMLPQLARYYDEPFADSSAIPMLYLARLAREGVKVALSGDGADEVFGGYTKYFKCVFEQRVRAVVSERIRRPVFSAAARYYPAFASLPRIFQSRMLLENLAQDTPAAYFHTMSTFGAEAPLFLNPDLRAEVAGYVPGDLFRDKFRAVQHLAPLEQLQYVDMETYLPGDILVKVDRATMAYSLESRAPWLDHRLIEFAGALPPSFKLSLNRGKLILKSAMTPYLPRQVIHRAKMGFGVPRISQSGGQPNADHSVD